MRATWFLSCVPEASTASAAEAFFVAGRSIEQFEEQNISEPRINDRIRVPEVRLVGPGGEQVGVVRIEVALNLAQEADLDLVEVAPDARPPVAKLMDFGKFKYESDMKAREARRNQANTQLKEIRFRLKIDAHDYETKKGHVVRFLSAGDKVKTMIMFRGREQSRPEMGVRLLQRLAADVEEFGFVESMPKQDGRNMIMVLGPTKKKAEAKNEQRKRTSERAVRTAAKPEVASDETTAALVEAAGVETAAVEAAAAAQAAPVEAATTAVAASEPAERAVASEAAPAESGPAQAPAKPAAAKPAAAKPAAAKPASSKPAAAKPATAKPTSAKPAAAKPAAAKPAAAPKPSESSSTAAAKARPVPRPKPAEKSS